MANWVAMPSLNAQSANAQSETVRNNGLILSPPCPASPWMNARRLPWASAPAPTGPRSPYRTKRERKTAAAGARLRPQWDLGGGRGRRPPRGFGANLAQVHAERVEQACPPRRGQSHRASLALPLDPAELEAAPPDLPA